MTPKQQRFVDEYLIDLNGTKAAIRAGYSPRGADVQAVRLLGNASVASAVARAEAERSARTGITADRVLEELARLAFSDMGDFAEWGGADVVLKQSSEVDTRCVLEVKETPMKSGGKALGIKLHDKAAALKLAGQHVGLFTERHEVTGKDGGPVEVKDVTERGAITAAERAYLETLREQPALVGGEVRNGHEPGNGKT